MRRGHLFALLAVLLLASLQSAEALRITGGFEIGKLDPGDRRLMRVVLDNEDQPVALTGTYETAVTIPQAYNATQQDQVADWVVPESPTWSVPANQNRTFDLLLEVPEDAKSGEYSLLGNFEKVSETSSEGTTVGVRENLATILAFTVRGVDVVGRNPMPSVVRPGTELDTMELAVANHDDVARRVHAVQELWRNGSLVRQWVSNEADAGPDGGQVRVQYEPDILGLETGAYTVRTYAQWAGDGGITTQSRGHLEQPLYIGEGGTHFLQFAVRSEIGREELPDGGRIHLPIGAAPTVELLVANAGPAEQAEVHLELVVSRDGVPVATINRDPTAPIGEFTSVGFSFAANEPGTYQLVLRNAGEGNEVVWQGEIEAVVPDIVYNGPRLDGDRLVFGFDNDGVAVRACYSFEVRTAFDTQIPNYPSIGECGLLPPGRTLDVEQRINTTALPDGAYILRVEGDWTGRDGPAVHSINFTAPLRAAPEETEGPGGSDQGEDQPDNPAARLGRWIVGAAADPAYWPIILGAILLVAAILFWLWRRRKDGGGGGDKPPRKRIGGDDPPPPPAPPPPQEPQQPSQPGQQPGGQPDDEASAGEQAAGRDKDDSEPSSIRDL